MTRRQSQKLYMRHRFMSWFPSPSRLYCQSHVFLICHSCTVVIDVEPGQSLPLTNRAQKTDFVSFGTRIPVYTKVRHSYLRVPARSFIADNLHDVLDTFRLQPFDSRHPNHDPESARSNGWLAARDESVFGRNRETIFLQG
jgi:hypothetical protein